MRAGERGRACWDKELGTQRWALSTGSPSGAWGREEEVNSARGGGGLAEQALRLGLQSQGPTGGRSGCVEGSGRQGDSGNWRRGSRA